MILEVSIQRDESTSLLKLSTVTLLLVRRYRITYVIGRISPTFSTRHTSINHARYRFKRFKKFHVTPHIFSLSGMSIFISKSFYYFDFRYEDMPTV